MTNGGNGLLTSTQFTTTSASLISSKGPPFCVSSRSHSIVSRPSDRSISTAPLPLRPFAPITMTAGLDAVLASDADTSSRRRSLDGSDSSGRSGCVSPAALFAHAMTPRAAPQNPAQYPNAATRRPLSCVRYSRS